MQTKINFEIPFEMPKLQALAKVEAKIKQGLDEEAIRHVDGIKEILHDCIQRNMIMEATIIIKNSTLNFLNQTDTRGMTTMELASSVGNLGIVNVIKDKIKKELEHKVYGT